MCESVHAFPCFSSRCLSPANISATCASIYILCKTEKCAIWTSYSFQILHSVWFARSVNLALLRSQSLYRIESEQETVGSNRPLLAGAKGKMTFLCCLFWEGNRKNARAAVLFLLADPTPVNSSLPLQRHSPYSRSGFGCSRVLYSVNNTSSESSKLLWQ